MGKATAAQGEWEPTLSPPRLKARLAGEALEGVINPIAASQLVQARSHTHIPWHTVEKRASTKLNKLAIHLPGLLCNIRV